MISERIKYNNSRGLDANMYFWRTTQKQEIDYVEEKGNVLSAFEFKWKKDSFKKPKIFLDAYPGSAIELVNKGSYKKFIGID